MDFEYPEGATPLDADEAQGLRLTHITTLKELDIWEQRNIDQAVTWAFSGREKDILSELFIRKLHKQMFGDVWRWAGTFRTSNKNIGVMREEISIELRHLCEDTQYWIKHHTFEPDEIAARFHHRLVAIHPFANGNGRHARLITDLLLEKQLNSARFSWGGEILNDSGECRERYIAALRAADRDDYTLLSEFVRS
jgi:Fic-DOC domain mobile mystery protein B